MGLLAQAKNGDEQFWKRKFHAANGKAQHALIFFPFKFCGEGGSGFLFSFSLRFQHVPFKFPMCVPKGVPNSTSL
jgi:hypothetical protein